MGKKLCLSPKPAMAHVASGPLHLLSPLTSIFYPQRFPSLQGLPTTLTAWEAGLSARQSEGVVDIGSQQRAVTTGVLGSFQALVDEADYMGHCFKGPTT